MTVAMPQITGLAELPFDLKVKLIDKLLRDSSQQFNFAVTVQLRLICKSWQGAVAAYPAAIQCTQPKHLLGICKAFPMMTCLILQYVEDPDIPSPSLSPLAECFHLKYLKIDQHQHWGDGLDLSFLPKSLCSLELVRVTVDTSKLDFITLPQVSQLSITDLSLSLSNTERLLEKMPSVKEVIVKDHRMVNAWQELSSNVAQMWRKSQELTHLKLDVGNLSTLDLSNGSKNTAANLFAPALRSLHLSGFKLEAEWLKEVPLSLPWLTSLTLSDCQISNQHRISSGLLSMLRQE